MTRYSEHVSNTITPQTEKARAEQVENDAGGHVFQADMWKRLDRFLILGTEGGTFYANERAHTKQAATAVAQCIQADGPRTVARIVEISEAGRAAKNDPAIFALAMASGAVDAATRQAALAAIPRVCRIGTHILHFAADVEHFRRWGRSLRTAMSNWYNEKTPEQVAFQMIKYQQRDGWAHKDILRLAHPKPKTPAHRAIFRYAQLGADDMGKLCEGKRDKEPVSVDELPQMVRAFEQIHASGVTPASAVALIREHRLPHECVPNELKSDPKIWEAMLPSMGVTALIRNLGKLSSLGMTKSLGDATKFIVEQLENDEVLKKGRVHPLTVLYAMKTYAGGHGLKGSLTWEPERAIVDALDGAFYKSFGFVEPTGKNIMLALDVSGSMSSAMSGTAVSCREASSAMAMVTARSEKNWLCVGFTSGAPGEWTTDLSRHPGLHIGQSYAPRYYGRQNDGLFPIALSPRQRLDDVCNMTGALPMGGTDCALPMLYAIEKQLPVDAFVIYTDSDTWAGEIHPFQALRAYRQQMNRPRAKLIVVGMTSNGFTIADPSDLDSLDVVGFDTATPAAMAEFIRG